MSAEKPKPRLRIIGMCPDDAKSIGSVRAAGPEAGVTVACVRDEAARLTREVRAGYSVKLGEGGLKGEAAKRVEALKLVTMEEYKQERNYATFA